MLRPAQRDEDRAGRRLPRSRSRSDHGHLRPERRGQDDAAADRGRPAQGRQRHRHLQRGTSRRDVRDGANAVSPARDRVRMGCAVVAGAPQRGRPRGDAAAGGSLWAPRHRTAGPRGAACLRGRAVRRHGPAGALRRRASAGRDCTRARHRTPAVARRRPGFEPLAASSRRASWCCSPSSRTGRGLPC